MDRVDFSNSNILARLDILLKAGCYQLNSFLYDDRCMLFRLGVESPFVSLDYPETLWRRHHSTNFSRSLKLLLRGTRAICGSERASEYPGGDSGWIVAVSSRRT